MAARAAAVEEYRDTIAGIAGAGYRLAGLEDSPFQISRLLRVVPISIRLTDGIWEQAAAWASHDRQGVIMPTNLRELTPSSLTECEAATIWWEELTRNGSEGMVVKPANSVTRHSSKLVQPRSSVGGRDYLRLIYGPTYLEQLEQLRSRNLGVKRSLALREFALGVEALERFVRQEPLRRVQNASSAFWRWRASRLTRACKEEDPDFPSLCGPLRVAASSLRRSVRAVHSCYRQRTFNPERKIRSANTNEQYWQRQREEFWQWVLL